MKNKERRDELSGEAATSASSGSDSQNLMLLELDMEPGPSERRRRVDVVSALGPVRVERVQLRRFGGVRRSNHTEAMRTR